MNPSCFICLQIALLTSGPSQNGCFIWTPMIIIIGPSSVIPSSQENNWQSPLFLLDIKKPRFLCSITWWFKWTVMCLVCLVLERAQAKQIEVGARGVKFPPGSWKTRSPFRHAFCLFLLELIWHGRLEWSIHKTRQNKHRSSFTPRRPHCLKQSLPG